jgi:hypothetical protein
MVAKEENKELLLKARETWKGRTVLAEFIERSCGMIRGKDGITKTQISKIWRNAGRERVYLRLKGTGGQLKWRILTKKTQSFEIKMDPSIALGLPQKVFTWSFTDQKDQAKEENINTQSSLSLSRVSI